VRVLSKVQKVELQLEELKINEDKLNNIARRAKNIKFLVEEAKLYYEKSRIIFKIPSEIREKLEKGEITEREYELLKKTYESIREYDKILKEYLPKYLQCLVSIINDSLGIYSELTQKSLITERASLLIQKTFLRLKGVREKRTPEVPMEELPIIKVKKFSMPKIKKEIEIKTKREKRTLERIFTLTPYYMLANSLFGEIYDRYRDKFASLENALRKAGIRILSRTYISTMLFTTWFAFCCSILLYLFLIVRFRTPLVLLVYLLPLIFFSIFYFYPYYKAKERRRNIDTNLPFAINHMGAIAASGLSPYHLFRIIAESGEYGEIRKEMGRVVGMSDDLGLDVVTSLKNVSSATPSENLSKFFLGVSSTIETGGDLRKFLEIESQKALFEYELRRRKYHELLSTYADIYAAVAVAAPLFLVAALTLMNALGGTIMGFSIQSLLWLGTYIILPFINIVFILFIEITQPQI